MKSPAYTLAYYYRKKEYIFEPLTQHWLLSNTEGGTCFYGSYAINSLAMASRFWGPCFVFVTVQHHKVIESHGGSLMCRRSQEQSVQIWLGWWVLSATSAVALPASFEENPHNLKNFLGKHPSVLQCQWTYNDGVTACLPPDHLHGTCWCSHSRHVPSLNPQYCMFLNAAWMNLQPNDDVAASIAW